MPKRIADNPCAGCRNNRTLRQQGRFTNVIGGYTEVHPTVWCMFCMPPTYSRYDPIGSQTAEEIMYGTRTQIQEVQNIRQGHEPVT